MLGRAGFVVAVSRARRGFGANALLAALLGPAVRAVLDGASPASIDRALCEAGYVRRVPPLIGALGVLAAARLVQVARLPEHPLEDVTAALAALSSAGASRSRPLPALLDAIDICLLDATLASLGPGEHQAFHHPSIVDLAARELLDFPLSSISLCRHLTPSRVRAALEGAGGLAHGKEVEAARKFLERGKGFYR